MHALFVLVSASEPGDELHTKLCHHASSAVRAWAVRWAGNAGDVSPAIRANVVSLAGDESPDVQLQVAIAARKLKGLEGGPLPLLLQVLDRCGDDELIPHIVWQNMHPLLDDGGKSILPLIREYDLNEHPNIKNLMPRITERIVAGGG